MFVQLIELTTTKVGEVQDLMDQWMAATEGRRTATHSLVTRDRDHPDTYVQVVEFGSYDDAMANSALPATAEFAAKVAGLCTSGPSFRNLDVIRTDEL